MSYCKEFDETLKEYKLRLYRNKDKYGLSHQQIAELINSASNSKKDESTYRKWYNAYQEGYMDGIDSSASVDAVRQERLKLQTEKLEWNQNNRIDARHSLFNEYIYNAIKNLPPIVVDYETVETEGGMTAILCIADEHYGAQIDIVDSTGNTVNAYSPEVFMSRMADLLAYMASDAFLISCDKLVVLDLGDAIQGILRLSDVVKMRTGVVDSVMQYADYMSYWLNALAKELVMPIEYVCLGGNHSETRYLSSKKGDFEDENMARIIREFVYLRLQNNKNITVHPFVESYYANISGVDILAFHGDGNKNVEKELHFWEDYYSKDIDVLLLGHEHHYEQVVIGKGKNKIEKQIIKCPGIVGVDTYSKKCRKLSRPGALLLTLQDGEIAWQRRYTLE